PRARLGLDERGRAPVARRLLLLARVRRDRRPQPPRPAAVAGVRRGGSGRDALRRRRRARPGPGGGEACVLGRLLRPRQGARRVMALVLLTPIGLDAGAWDGVDL